MRHNSSKFWLSLPSPEVSRHLAIGIIGSRTQFPVQREARFHPAEWAVPWVVCYGTALCTRLQSCTQRRQSPWGQRSVPHISTHHRPLVLHQHSTESPSSVSLLFGLFGDRALIGNCGTPAISCLGKHHFGHLQHKSQHVLVSKAKQNSV